MAQAWWKAGVVYQISALTRTLGAARRLAMLNSSAAASGFALPDHLEGAGIRAIRLRPSEGRAYRLG